MAEREGFELHALLDSGVSMPFASESQYSL
jgi:hypothetical protein